MQNPEMLKKIFGYLSSNRMNRYLKSTTTEARAFELYELNSELGAKLWPAIQYYEVVLRNLVDKALSQTFSENWIENESFLFALKVQKQNSIKSTIKSCARKNKSFTKNDVIADLSLSIWLEVVSQKFLDQVWSKCIDDIFPHRPHEQSVECFILELEERFKYIKTLRNRIAHHEPIYHLNIQNGIDAITFFLKATAPELLPVVNGHFQASQDTKHKIKVTTKRNNK